MLLTLQQYCDLQEKTRTLISNLEILNGLLEVLAFSQELVGEDQTQAETQTFNNKREHDKTRMTKQTKMS